MVRQSKSKFQVKKVIVIIEVRKTMFCVFSKTKSLIIIRTHSFGMYDYENFFLKALPKIKVFYWIH